MGRSISIWCTVWRIKHVCLREEDTTSGNYSPCETQRRGFDPYWNTNWNAWNAINSIYRDSYLLYPAREHNIRWIQMLSDWLATVFTLIWTSMCEIHIYLESFWGLVPQAFHWYSSSHYSDISSKICIMCFLVYYCIFLIWNSCREPRGVWIECNAAHPVKASVPVALPPAATFWDPLQKTLTQHYNTIHRQLHKSGRYLSPTIHCDNYPEV